MATTPKNIYRGTVGVGGTLGTTWFSRAVATGGNSGIVFGNGMFVTSNSATNYSPSYSTDGITWVGNASGNVASLAIAYGAGTFVRTFANAWVNSSTDASTWTQRTLPANASWASIAYGSGLFLTTADNSTSAATSPDGITWTSRTMPVLGYYRLAYGNGVFLAINTVVGTTVSYTSTDGINWTPRTVPVSTLSMVSFANGLFFTFNGSTLYTSPDGITWTTRTMPTSSGNWGTVAYGGGLYVAGNSSNFVATSPDAITWTRRSVPGTTYPQYLAFGNNAFVAAGQSGGISSHSGTTTLYTAGPSATAIITDIYLSNPQTTATLVSLAIDGVDLFSQYSIAANDRLVLATRQVVDANKSVLAYTNGGALNVHVNGVEII